MGQAEIVVIGLLVAVAGLSALARRRSLPYPIVLVLGGALLGFVPGLPEVRLDPEVVLVVFLPPLLYGSSSFANVNDFRGDLRWLALIPGLPWAAASVLGRSSRRPTRWPRRPSCAASVSPAAWSARSRRGPVQRRDRPGRRPGGGRRRRGRERSRRPRPACGSSSRRPAGWPSAWSSLSFRDPDNIALELFAPPG
jgi:hypothetical protein